MTTKGCRASYFMLAPIYYCKDLPFLLKNLSFCSKNPHKSVRYIQVSAITKHHSAVVAVLSAKSIFSAKTVSVKPSFWCISLNDNFICPRLKPNLDCGNYLLVVSRDSYLQAVC